MSRNLRASGIFSLGLACVAVTLGACGLRSSATLGENADGGVASGAVCISGAQLSCQCTTGGVGVEVCESSGAGYGPCLCGSNVGPAPTGSVSPPIAVDAGSPSVTPPAPPTNPTTPPPTTEGYAVHHVHLGDELDSNGNPSWYLYGYDLDGKVTTSTSTDVCTLAANANAKNQVDGPGGIDNSFGENFIPLLSAVIENPSQTADNEIASGDFSWIFSIAGLSSDPLQSSSGLGGSYFLGAPFGASPNASGAKPTFGTADNWPVDSAMVTSAIGPSGALVPPVTAQYPFAGMYVVGGELVSGSPAVLDLAIGVSGQLLHLKVQHAVVTFDHSSPTQATGGIIAGVIATEDLVSSLQAIAGSVSTSLCTGNAFAQIATSIRQASDIMVDGTNNPGTPCDGISIGVGFDAAQIAAPAFAGPLPTVVDPCGGG